MRAHQFFCCGWAAHLWSEAIKEERNVGNPGFSSIYTWRLRISPSDVAADIPNPNKLVVCAP